jgi:hypothetical protein
MVTIETLLPILYRRVFRPATSPKRWRRPLGKDATGLSASAIGRLEDGWLDEHGAWQKRDLSAKRYVYIWADGIHLEARLEDEKQCILVPQPPHRLQPSPKIGDSSVQGIETPMRSLASTAFSISISACRPALVSPPLHVQRGNRLNGHARALL